MKRYLAVAALVLTIGCFSYFPCGISAAQEQTQGEFSWGTVKSVSSNGIVVKEYNYNDEEVEVTYALDPNVRLYNVGSLQDIAAGSEVWIEYAMSGSERVALSIEIKEASSEEGNAPAQPIDEGEEDTTSTSCGEEAEY